MATKEAVRLVRLRNINTGAVVQVREEKAARMGTEWESADSPRRTPATEPKSTRAPAKKATARKSTARTAKKAESKTVSTDTVTPDTAD